MGPMLGVARKTSTVPSTVKLSNPSSKVMVLMILIVPVTLF
jgi:hypothetical protein